MERDLELERQTIRACARATLALQSTKWNSGFGAAYEVGLGAELTCIYTTSEIVCRGIARVVDNSNNPNPDSRTLRPHRVEV